MNAERCDRCGGEAESRDNIRGTTFWGSIQRRTAVHRVLYRATYLRKFGRDADTPALQVHEEQPLCSDCWGLLVGRFLQGRSVPAMPGKEDR